VPTDPFLDAREAYARGENVMARLREQAGIGFNSDDAVLVAYDLQSGSYRRGLEDPATAAVVERYADGIARELGALDFETLLDAGVGEATTLVPVLQRLASRRVRAAGFDVSWSRVAHARAHAGALAPELFVGDLFAMPIRDDAFDLVLTAHALEPNGGRERDGLAALARVARRWIVAFEPSYELGDQRTREHILAHGYVRNLRGAAEELGLTVIKHELLPERTPAHNQTAVLVLRKDPPSTPAEAAWQACPRCHGPLRLLKGSYFCAGEGLAYPIIDGLACLVARNAVVASAFADEL